MTAPLEHIVWIFSSNFLLLLLLCARSFEYCKSTRRKATRLGRSKTIGLRVESFHWKRHWSFFQQKRLTRLLFRSWHGLIFDGYSEECKTKTDAHYSSLESWLVQKTYRIDPLEKSRFLSRQRTSSSFCSFCRQSVSSQFSFS